MKMNNIAKCILAMFICPSLAIAQMPKYYDSFPYRAREYFYMYIGWSLVGLILVLSCTALLVFFFRKHSKNPALLILGFLFFAIWHFYPAFTYKGTYQASIQGKPETVYIAESYHPDGREEKGTAYRVMPFQRMLWVEMDLPDMKYVPVKLGWNKIYQPVLKIGLVKFTKIPTNQNMAPMVKTPIE